MKSRGILIQRAGTPYDFTSPSLYLHLDLQSFNMFNKSTWSRTSLCYLQVIFNSFHTSMKFFTWSSWSNLSFSLIIKYSHLAKLKQKVSVSYGIIKTSRWQIHANNLPLFYDDNHLSRYEWWTRQKKELSSPFLINLTNLTNPSSSYITKNIYSNDHDNKSVIHNITWHNISKYFSPLASSKPKITGVIVHKYSKIRV